MTPVADDEFSNGSQLLAPQFDAYSRGNALGGVPRPPNFGQSMTPGTANSFGTAQPGLGLGPAGTPPGQPWTGPGYNQVPPVAFPHANPQLPSWNGGFGGGFDLKPMRVIQGARFKHTWVHGGDKPPHLDINDSAISLAMVYPNFLQGPKPLVILPSFELHLWDGPQAMATSTAELPPQAYSAYLDAYWETDPIPGLGFELGTRVGLFTDFKGTTTDSLRILGKGLLRLDLVQQLSVRIGAYYVDRARIKMLPAGGLLWKPNDNTRFDIFFPEPKLAQKFVTLGTTDVWWYLAGEFGGGSWTFERTGGDNDRLDINDVRAILGFEFGTAEMLKAGQRTAFVEVGFVWDREVIYVARPFDSFKPRDTIMIRAGIGY